MKQQFLMIRVLLITLLLTTTVKANAPVDVGYNGDYGSAKIEEGNMNLREVLKFNNISVNGEAITFDQVINGEVNREEVLRSTIDLATCLNMLSKDFLVEIIENNLTSLECYDGSLGSILLLTAKEGWFMSINVQTEKASATYIAGRSQ